MKFFAVAFVALFALQGVLAAPPKKQQPAVEKSVLEEIAAKTQKTINDAATQLEKDLPDSKAVVDTLNKQTQEAADTLKAIGKKLSDELTAHKPEVDDLLKKVQARITEAGTQLEATVGPDTTTKAKELRKNLEANLKTAFTEVEKLVKASEPDVKKAQDDFSAFTKSALESLQNLSSSVQQQLKTAVADHEKTHKH